MARYAPEQWLQQHDPRKGRVSKFPALDVPSSELSAELWESEVPSYVDPPALVEV